MSFVVRCYICGLLFALDGGFLLIDMFSLHNFASTSVCNMEVVKRLYSNKLLMYFGNFVQSLVQEYFKKYPENVREQSKDEEELERSELESLKNQKTNGQKRVDIDGNESASMKKNAVQKPKKKYVPSFRSGNFAILITLHRTFLEGHDYVTLSDLKQRCEMSNLSATSFYSTEGTGMGSAGLVQYNNFHSGRAINGAGRGGGAGGAGFYSAWNGMTQLMNKHCYVHGWSNNPKKFRLTPEGRGNSMNIRHIIICINFQSDSFA